MQQASSRIVVEFAVKDRLSRLISYNCDLRRFRVIESHGFHEFSAGDLI